MTQADHKREQSTTSLSLKRQTFCFYLNLMNCSILSTSRSLVTGFNFSSSGREDVDVRTLGNGQNDSLNCP